MLEMEDILDNCLGNNILIVIRIYYSFINKFY